MNLKDDYDSIVKFNLVLDPEKYCCVCFKDLYFLNDENLRDLSLADIQNNFFINDTIPNNLLIKSCCNIHYICIECLRKCVNNYENHPINENESHIYCPYPFEDCLTKIGFRNIFEHHHIKKICTTESEWMEYSYHADKHAFPGFTIMKCPMFKCNTDILIKTETIKNTSIGDLIIKCSQNPKCSKKFCYYCKQSISYYSTICYDCKTSYENENPNVYNYYINKLTHDSPLEEIQNNKEIQNEEMQNEEIQNEEIQNRELFTDNGEIDSSIESVKIQLNYKESSYLYLNKDITEDIVISQITDILNDVNIYMICCICRRSLYKTEKCNGLSHHNLERCYACGRIGFTVKGLIEHWNTNGISGCFRFDTDSYVKKIIPEYICNDTICSNHEIGDCKIAEHSIGIYKLEKLRLKSYIYHIIKSLLPEMSLKVYDTLHEKYKNDDKIYELLPYKQTLLLLHKYKFRYKDFSEEIFYSQLKCIYPEQIDDFYINKNYTIEIDEYIQKYTFYEKEYKKEYEKEYDSDSEIMPLLITDIIIENNIENNIDDNIDDNVMIEMINTMDRMDRMYTVGTDTIDTIDITDTIDTINITGRENVLNLLNNYLPSNISLSYTTLDENDIINEIIEVYNRYTDDEDDV
jgi:hypothetical protein